MRHKYLNRGVSKSDERVLFTLTLSTRPKHAASWSTVKPLQSATSTAALCSSRTCKSSIVTTHTKSFFDSHLKNVDVYFNCCIVNRRPLEFVQSIDVGAGVQENL